LNEPWVGNFLRDQNLFLEPDKSDRELLFPFAQRMDAAIRKVDQQKAIFFEIMQFPDNMPFFGGIVFGPGYPDSPGGEEYANRQVFNDHAYCCQAGGEAACPGGEPTLDLSDMCRSFHKRKADTRRASADLWGVPLIFSEFGACFDTIECATEISNSVDAYDDAMSSWAYWGYKSFGDHTTSGGIKEGMFHVDGTTQKYKLKSLTRTYIHAWQGEPLQMYFNTKDATFTASMKFDATIKAPTEIYIFFDEHYPDGYTATASVEGLETSGITIA